MARPPPSPGQSLGKRRFPRTPLAEWTWPSSVSLSGPRRTPRVPWGPLLRALGRFRLSLPDIRQREKMLSTYDPLSLDHSPHLSEEEEEEEEPEIFWGDHQPLSKVPYKILSGHKHAVSSCHFCVNDTKIISSSFDCTVKLWNAFDGSVIRDFEKHPKAPVIECSITADSKRVAASSYDKSVRVWDTETGKLLWKVRYDTFVMSCKFSPDGKYVVTALDLDNGICIMDAKNITNVIHVSRHHKRSIMACCFDPDSHRVASVSMDRCIKIWDVTTKSTLFTIKKAHLNAISNCCFTFSGHFLCTSSWDKNLKIWNVHTGDFRNQGACVTLMQGHEGCVSCCHFATDNSYLISGGLDNTVAIWDVGEGYRKLSLTGHTDWVMDVSVSNSNKWILSASKDKTMRLWNIEEIDEIPLVMNYKKAMGLQMQQCKQCNKPFSTESDTSSEIFTKCMFCRREEDDDQAQVSFSPQDNSQAN